MDGLCTARVTGQHKTPSGKRKCPVCGVPARRSSIAQAKPELGGKVKKDRDSVQYLDSKNRLHREDGPALVEYHPNGVVKREAWLEHGEPRDMGDEPNEIARDHEEDTVRKSWYAPFVTESGVDVRRLHREDGPAVVSESKKTVVREWMINGARVGNGPNGETKIATDAVSGDVVRQEWHVPEGGTGLVSRHRPTISPKPNEVWMVKGERMASRSKAYSRVSGISQDNEEALDYLYQFPIEELSEDHPAVAVAAEMFNDREV